MGDGQTMDIGRSEQAQLQHSASMAGQDLHQRQVDQWQHSPVLRSVYQNQNAPFPSVPVEIRSQQQHQCINQPSHQIPAGNNEWPIDSLPHDGQSAVQAPPPPSSSGRFPLDREQYLDEQFRQMREASDKYFDSMNRLMELQYQAFAERMKTVNQQMQLMFSLCWATRVPQPTYESSPASTQEGTQHKASYPNDVDTTAAVINEEQPRQPRVDQLIVPEPALRCDDQQQQKEEMKKTIFVPAPPDGRSDEIFEHAQQNECAAEVFKSSDVASLRGAEIISDKHPPIGAIESDRKFVQYFLDRHGHRMDLARGRASVFSDVFEWMIHNGGIRIKLRSSVHDSSSTWLPATLSTLSTIIALPVPEDRCNGLSPNQLEGEMLRTTGLLALMLSPICVLADSISLCLGRCTRRH